MSKAIKIPTKMPMKYKMTITSAPLPGKNAAAKKL